MGAGAAVMTSLNLRARPGTTSCGGRRWSDVERLGKIRHIPARGGWCIEFRTVHWPGRAKPRRVFVTSAPDYGRFGSEEEALKSQLRIQARMLDGQRQLHEVLARYINEVPEDLVMHRWRVDWLPEVRTRHRSGKLSQNRLDEFESYERRGYLTFWETRSIHGIDGRAVRMWLRELEHEKPNLKPKTLRHIVADFGTFTRWMVSEGALEKAPPLPRIDVPAYMPKVPGAGDLARVLAKIPEEIRGLWLARSLAGLRPSEARRLDVSEYRDGVILIPAQKSKTKRPRSLDVRCVAPALDTWIAKHRSSASPAEPLFLNPRGQHDRRWTETPERRVWVGALEAAEVEHVKPNEGGRHAFITHEIARGTDPYAVKDWAGHTTLATTERYKSVTAVDLARRMRPARERLRSESEMRTYP